MDPSAIVLLCYVCLLFFAIILYDSLPKGKLCYKTLSVRAFYRWICFGCFINCYWVPAIILESKIQKKKNADNQMRVINTGTCLELRSDINSLKESVHRIEQEIAHICGQVRDISTDTKHLLRKFKKSTEYGIDHDPSTLDLPDLCFSVNIPYQQRAFDPLPTEPLIQPADHPILTLDIQDHEDYEIRDDLEVDVQFGTLELGDVRTHNIVV